MTNNALRVVQSQPLALRGAAHEAAEELLGLMNKYAGRAESDRELVRAYTEEAASLRQQLKQIKDQLSDVNKKKQEAQSQLDESSAVYEAVGGAAQTTQSMTKGKTNPPAKRPRKRNTKKQ